MQNRRYIFKMAQREITPFMAQGTCLLIEDHPQSMTFLQRAILECFPQLEINSFTTLSDARNWLEKYDGLPALALIDLGLPDGSGVEMIDYLRRKHPDTISVVVTIYDDDAHLFEALSAGANGYLLKDETPELLTAMLKRITSGEPPLSPSIAQRLLSRFRTPLEQVPAKTQLTARETETLKLLAQGYTVSEVARHLGLSPQTVASYVKVIYQKLHVSNRARATHEAIRRGLI